MELIINHRSVCEGGPTHVTVADGAATIGQVIALFKEQKGVTCPIRLRDGRRVLRSTDTLDEVGIQSGRALVASKNAGGSPAYQALRRIEQGISSQSRAHGEMTRQISDVATAVSSGFSESRKG